MYTDGVGLGFGLGNYGIGGKRDLGIIELRNIY